MQKSLPIAVAALFLAACSSDIQNAEAVRAGVLDYLTTNQSKIGLDPNAMQIDVTSVSFQKDQARAAVAFRPKNGGDAGGPMVINYVLNRKGNKWVVAGRTENGTNPHGGAANESPQLPPGHPSTGTPPPTGGQLPPGHPSVGSKQ